MTIEKQQFYSDAFFYIFARKTLKFDGKLSGSFAVIPKCFVQMEQYCARLSQAYKLLKATRNSEIAALYFEKCFKWGLT